MGGTHLVKLFQMRKPVEQHETAPRQSRVPCQSDENNPEGEHTTYQLRTEDWHEYATNKRANTLSWKRYVFSWSMNSGVPVSILESLEAGVIGQYVLR